MFTRLNETRLKPPFTSPRDPLRRSLRLSSIAVVWMLPLTVVTPLQADEPAPAAAPHVRPLTADARDLVSTGLARSELIRKMVDHLEASDLVVYVALRWFMADRTGQLTFIGSTGGVRYAMIRIGSGHILSDEIATLGHELRHAVEVADAPAVVDRVSFARHYAAVEAGQYVARELAEPLAGSRVGGR